MLSLAVLKVRLALVHVPANSYAEVCPFSSLPQQASLPIRFLMFFLLIMGVSLHRLISVHTSSIEIMENTTIVTIM